MRSNKTECECLEDWHKVQTTFQFYGDLKKTQNGTLNIRKGITGEVSSKSKVDSLKNCTDKFKIIFRIKN